MAKPPRLREKRPKSRSKIVGEVMPETGAGCVGVGVGKTELIGVGVGVENSPPVGVGVAVGTGVGVGVAVGPTAITVIDPGMVF